MVDCATLLLAISIVALVTPLVVVDIGSTVVSVDGSFDDVLLSDVVFSELETRGDVAEDCLVDLPVSDWEKGNVKGRVKLLYWVVEIFVKSGNTEL